MAAHDTTRAKMSLPRNTTGWIEKWKLNGESNRWGGRMAANQNGMAVPRQARICDRPTVMNIRISLGAWAKRRMMTRSTNEPRMTALIRAMGMAIQYDQPRRAMRQTPRLV